MRVVLDTNVLISGLIGKTAAPASIVDHWLDDGFTLVTAEWQIEEIRRVSRRPKLRARLKPHLVGGLVNRMRSKAQLVANVPAFDLSSDPDDNPLIAIAVTGRADYLVTGDKSDLLGLKKTLGVPVVTARKFLEVKGLAP